jgi:transcriptional regulator GlxA family with amidase domain
VFEPSPSGDPHRVAFILIPSFSMMAFSAAIEPLRTANRLADKELYIWELVTSNGEPVTASNGVTLLPYHGLQGVRQVDSIIVCAGLRVESYHDPTLFQWLADHAKRGTRVGGVCTASILLARAGLLAGYRCTVHWENVEAFVEEFPYLQITATLYEVDRDRFTCSGGTAPLDMMINAVFHCHGRELAIQVAEEMLHAVPRYPHDPQRMSLRYRTGLSNPKLLAVIAQMEAYLEAPMSLDELGASAGLSKRQLERLFRTHLDRTPKRYYLELRLRRAQQLLRQTTMSILQVAVACGFASSSHFAKSYHALFDRSPREERRNASVELT